jgi:hypothetical protein
VTELPLVLTILAAFGVVSSRGLRRNRRYALLVGAVLAAFLTPPDVVSMMMMLLPVLILYEISIWAAWLIERRRARSAAAGAVVLWCLLVPDLASSQEQRDTTARRPLGTPTGERLDTAAARALGLPTGPERTLPTADSLMTALLARGGFETIRYRADTVTLFAVEREVRFRGAVRLDRGTAILEADSVRYYDETCAMNAGGEPALFDAGTVLIGEAMLYDACIERGVVDQAITEFDQNGVNWYLRGQLAVDSSSSRFHAGRSRITSCELPSAHYHFHARKLKWISERVLIARPAILYVRDVPVLWLPFIFQDIRPGRRSGILVPKFGINDLVRPSRSYERHLTGVGYYWAMSDYTDAQVTFDWYSNRYIAMRGAFAYRWLDRFVQGGLRVGRQQQSDGASSTNIQWYHRQNFSSRTSLVASVNYASNSRVVQDNAVDPTDLTANIDSRINYSRTLDWGRLDFGGSRTQSITSPSVSQTLPTIALAPSAVNLGRSVTWSPSFRLTNSQDLNQSAGVLLAASGGGTDTLVLLANTRRTTANLNTPIRIGSWNWSNAIAFTDFWTDRRAVRTELGADSASQIVTAFAQDFSTGIDWTTGIGLPTLLRSSWRLQPSISVQNVTSGPFLVRNRNTGGEWVAQGKRFSFGASLSPTLFGFFPGVGPIMRIRHALSPSLSWRYAPSASVPEAYARALDPSGVAAGGGGRAVHQLVLGLSQVFEGKFTPEPGDTAADPRNARKSKLLQLNTSSFTYDFERAKLPGQNGWVTQRLTNTFTSELLRGMSVSITHDLWDGPAGFDTTQFDPFLSNVSARATINAGTVTGLLGLLGLARAPEPSREPTRQAADSAAADTGFTGVGSPIGGRFTTLDRMAPTRFGGRGFTLALTYDVTRARPRPGPVISQDRRNMGIALNFSPTAKWTLAWNTAYNFERQTFEQQVLRLDRDLHRWQASFSFVRLANGNFVFNFSVSLRDQPDIKIDYDQQTFGN